MNTITDVHYRMLELENLAKERAKKNPTTIMTYQSIWDILKKEIEGVLRTEG